MRHILTTREKKNSGLPVMWKKIIESQNGLGWKGPLKVI